ncbi:hypothetical protein [Frankia sp. Cppng1_Ct_nod]|uniref:hypothetical protein n=1 Tax=Frankia sp. Cppng1_Ct_nod TaxID=2897162 RepID=UPI0010412130|nr:hypothetical protein [Frankia sp. Cppng1_Ct_nod]
MRRAPDDMGTVGMPKNYGSGVAVDSWRMGGMRGLVRLGRIELWTRLDRNMVRSSGIPGPDESSRRHRRDAGRAG